MFRIKICGVTSEADANMVAAAGADAIGLNFYPKSPRYADPELAERVVAAVPPGVAKVGVFVNEPPEIVRRIGERLGLDYLQLHGDEPVEWLEALAGNALIRAFRCRQGSLEPLGEYVRECERRNVELAGVLVDAYAPGAYGGTGQVVDWHAVAQWRTRFPTTPIILAGGLTAANVGEAIRTARPDAVDTASGVEDQPGRKSGEKVAAFVHSARDAWNSSAAAER